MGNPSGKKLRHVAVIMDGNARWACQNGQSVAEGHRQGAAAVQRCIAAAIKHDVPYLTLYAFSSENWRRAPEEVAALTALLSYYLSEKVGELVEQGVRLKVIGEPERFGGEIGATIAAAERRTALNNKLCLTLALSYGSRSEIANACRHLAQEVAAGRCAPASIDEGAVAASLQTAALPDPDIIVRTSGEKRLSNFLLWQAAYAELLFLDVLWPDFSEQDFEHVVHYFATRQRRFGGRPS
nr:polyprenyl diphosphate synthase [Formicincola oecophyllae]